MSIPSTFDASKAEEKWYSHWLDQGFFHSEPDDRPAYTVVIPPPNVTGVLHMGHVLNNTIQDVLVRRARMQGFNACWVPGTDHASIATEAKVVKRLREKGIKKSDLSREEFLSHAWEWKEEHGTKIFDQLQKIGASCDWDRAAFTMDPELSKAVIKTFVALHNKGLIYRGLRMVNWDPEALTAVSDEEVIHEEGMGKLYHVRYKIAGTEDEWVTIATTRPETILGDTAVCINPDDERYNHLHGKQVEVPFTGRAVPIILDDYVTMDFGTGCLKVTPAHDVNDFELGQKHNLETIDIFNANGTLNQHGGKYNGMDRFDVRKAISKDLEAAGHLVKVEDYANKVGHSERTKAVIEPRLSLQWFVKMDVLAKPALEVVEEGKVQLHPAKFINTYRHWMNNVRDWCISRQLWWGQQIPAYFYGEGEDEFVVAESAEEALALAREKSGNADLQASDLKQDEDVVDTWFSSWLWPISVFDGFKDPDNKEINYYYPTNALVTGPDILFFWVARMIMAGLEYRDEIPFHHVYLTGLVRDEQRRKMSKQLGNSPDPLDLVAEYGADGVRVGMLLTAPAGNDLLFPSIRMNEKGEELSKKEIKAWDGAGKEKLFTYPLCVQGRNFTNKMWQAYRLIKGWEVDESLSQPESAQLADTWFTSKFNEALEQLEEQYKRFRISDALMTTYKLVWDEFCSWYLEAIKPEYQKPVDPTTLKQAIAHFERVLRIVHPFTPFISEEIWHGLNDRSAAESLIVSSWPEQGAFDATLISDMEAVKQVIAEVRGIRQKNGMAKSKPVALQAKVNQRDYSALDALLNKLGILESLDYVQEKPSGAIGFMVEANEYFVKLEEAEFDVEEAIAKLKTDLEYQQGFLKTVMKKLSNERFVSGAPAQVVEIERKKQADAEARIKVIEEQLADLTA